MMRRILAVLVGAMALAGCGGGGGGGGPGGATGGATTCAEIFSEANLCQFTCGVGTGTSAATVGNTLIGEELAPGHGCVEEPGAGFSCLNSCVDDPTGNEMNVDLHFDSGGHLWGIQADTRMPDCLYTKGCMRDTP